MLTIPAIIGHLCHIYKYHSPEAILYFFLRYLYVFFFRCIADVIRGDSLRAGLGIRVGINWHNLSDYVFPTFGTQFNSNSK